MYIIELNSLNDGGTAPEKTRFLGPFPSQEFAENIANSLNQNCYNMATAHPLELPNFTGKQE